MRNSKQIIAAAAIAASGLLMQAERASASLYWASQGATADYASASSWISGTTSTGTTPGAVPNSSSTVFIDYGGIATTGTATYSASQLAIGSAPSIHPGTGELDNYGMVTASTLTEVGGSSNETDNAGLYVDENSSALLKTVALDVFSSGPVEIVDPSSSVVPIQVSGLVKLSAAATIQTDPGPGGILDIVDPDYTSFVLATYGSLSTTASTFTTIELNGAALITNGGTTGTNGAESITINYGSSVNKEITVTVTPEPATLGLLGVSATGLLLRRRRRRGQSWPAQR
jgi:hypothetical protein